VSWTPIRYVNRVYSRSVLAGLYRTARVSLVTPLRDGMNLVAKEYERRLQRLEGDHRNRC
jgi:trehalose 6-phosphate synthase